MKVSIYKYLSISNVFPNVRADCKAQIDGIKYPKYRKFNSLEEANQFIQDNAKHKAVDKAEFHKNLKKVYPVSSVQVQQVRQLSTVPHSNHNFQSDDDGYVQVYTDGACGNNGKNNAKAGVGVWFGQNHAL